MPINETVYLHRNHRVCIGKNGTQKIWNKYSFWTHASDVWFNDGTTLENKISGLKGTTTNIDSGAGYAADVTLVKSIRDSLKSLIDNLSTLVNSINNRLGGLSFYEDSNGKWVVGADSVPKKLGSNGFKNKDVLIHRMHYNFTRNISTTVDGGNYAYGNLSVFDLTIFPDYQNFIFGENILVDIESIGSSQENVGYACKILYNKKLQRNIDSPIDKHNVVYNSFWGTKAPYAPNFDVNDEEDYVILQQRDKTVETVFLGDVYNYPMALYYPTTGQLYCVIPNTSNVSSILLFKI